MDLAGIFTLLLVVAGLILLTDWAVFKKRRLHGAGGALTREPLLVQYARSFFPVVLIVLLLRAFVFEPFRIPSASMMPGLVAGDFIFVNKFAYGFRLTPGHYFFMGDNRNDSEDSRFPIVGFVPERNLVGHAVRIWMNWQLPGWPDWRRIGMKIR